MAMMARTGRILTVFVAALVLFAGQRPAPCQAWSILHPLTFDSTPQPKPKTTVLKSTQKPPSTFDQIVSAPKNLVTKVGDTITGKKSEPVKPSPTMIARPTPPVLNTPKKSSSWVPSWLQTEQPKPAKTVPEWMAQPRVDQ
jgi:hypothetical protein